MTLPTAEPTSATTANQRLAKGPWAAMVVAALLLCAGFIVCMEIGLSARGFHPTLADSKALWSRQRTRAASLGKRALILVGSSRMQSDIDLDELRQLTDLDPVQLAMPADPGIPILAGLAADRDVRGTVLVEVLDSAEASRHTRWHSADFEDYYETHRKDAYQWDFATTESYLEGWLRSRLRSYADGTRPVTAFSQRLLNANPERSFVTLSSDRERWLDFSLTDTKKLYDGRVNALLAPDARVSAKLPQSAFEAEVSRKIGLLTPADNRAYLRNIQSLIAMSAAIVRRGGRVIFVAMPLSGDVRAIMEARYPRALFWDHFAHTQGVETFNFADDRYMRTITCPDGSHMDVTDRAPFTAALVDALHLNKRTQPPSASGE